MGKAMFYHLTQRPLEAALPQLLTASLGRGWNVAVRGPDPARLSWLDERLWQGAPDSFLPHGIAGGPHDTEQPVLLTTGEASNQATVLMTIDGAEVSADEVNAYERTCVLFNGFEEHAVAQARTQWKALTSAGCAAEYWSEESGRWEMKAESAAS
ncbi:DNA polymerase III subunit chi [Lentibacter algarum]|uniref:DNA polymerase III subunit chi n=1 Tax=Lentibacter algarum TaxID=576131 RepID=UPI001C0A26A1|nr:DNA polymerase III subunit chi [Lentibacter algarum]MBU2982765.1 DNA polymerase III subunit chi [Lentibacter algarum]